MDHEEVRGSGRARGEDQKGGSEAGSSRLTFPDLNRAELPLRSFLPSSSSHFSLAALPQPNHLLGYRREYIALYFKNQPDLFSVRRELLPIATKNREKLDAVDTYAEVISGESMFEMDHDIEEAGFLGKGGKSFAQAGGGAGAGGAASDSILDIREYDVPYYLRVAIDKGESSVFAALARARR
jgi:hypothetical protein